MFCSATMQVSSFAATLSRRLSTSATARRCRLRYASRRTRSSLARSSSGLAAFSSFAISFSIASPPPAATPRSRSDSATARNLTFSASASASGRRRDARALGARHALEQAKNLVAVGFGPANSLAVWAGDAHDVVARSDRQARDRRRAGLAGLDALAALLAHRLPLVAVERGADVGEEIVGHVDQIAVARLAEDVAPIVAVAQSFAYLNAR